VSDQFQPDVLLMGRGIMWELHRQRESRLRNGRKGLDFEINARVLNCSHCPRIHTQVAPATASQKTANAANSEAQRNGRGQDIGHLAQWETACEGISDHHKSGKDESTVKNQPPALHCHPLEEACAVGLIKQPTEKTCAKKADQWDEEDNVVNVTSCYAKTRATPSGQEITGKEGEQHAC
jgi:hypothetical protein